MVQVHSMPQCAKINYCTHTHKTYDLKPMSFPVPMTILNKDSIKSPPGPMEECHIQGAYTMLTNVCNAILRVSLNSGSALVTLHQPTKTTRHNKIYHYYASHEHPQPLIPIFEYCGSHIINCITGHRIYCMYPYHTLKGCIIVNTSVITTHFYNMMNVLHKCIIKYTKCGFTFQLILSSTSLHHTLANTLITAPILSAIFSTSGVWSLLTTALLIHVHFYTTRCG